MLFLSYAEEDGNTGLEVAEWLADRGFDVYYWQDPRRRGGRFIEQIEKAIGEADAFVALLSPSFLRSTWCRQERDMALRREHALRVGAPETIFVHVLKVGDMPPESAGLLGSYDWTDLTSPRHRDQALSDLAGRLGPTRGETGKASLAAPAPDRAAVKRESYGHRAELDHVVRGLTSASGPHFWLVTAPPGLGKSRFLRQLSTAMSGPGTTGWATHLVDVQEQPSDVRGDANALLARLLGLTVGAGADAEAWSDIATEIDASGKSFLCLLDGAELLDERTAADFRRGLGDIYRSLQASAPASARFALVVASHRDAPWRGIAPAPRLSLLRLREFRGDDVRRSLRDLASQTGAQVSNAVLREATDFVLRLTEGLPVLVVRCLEWIRREKWQRMERLESQAVFDELAEPYIQQRLLTPEGLGPGSRGGAGQRRYALEQAFRVLAPYRLFTLSHLRHHIESDPVLRGSLENAAWSTEDLWGAISDSALLAPLDEPWLELQSAIRRLLFRFYYDSAERRARAHREARAFVEVWSGQQLGKEQVIGTVECLWHQAEALRLSGSASTAGELSASAERLFDALQPSATYSAAELRAYAAERMRGDAEFQQAVHDVTGLAGMVVAPTLSGYVSRPEELRITEQAALVQEDLRSRVVLLYGPGGAGKTSLVRQLALANTAEQTTIWLDPIDLDDPESWLLSNLERRVARRMDPENRYFGPYHDYISRLPVFARPPVNSETVLGHLGRVKRIFTECYTRFVAETGMTVVMTFDTVEAIRGMYLLVTLTQWMKALPNTLFIVSGRENHRSPDPIRTELEDSHASLPVTTVSMGGFTWHAALGYLNASPVVVGLTDNEKAKLVHLTRGHPLWMAFTISYLKEIGLPAEAETVPLADIERDLPYDADMTAGGRRLHMEFTRRLMTPYRGTDFWHESVRRLAVMRQNISKDFWQSLMSDFRLPAEVAGVDQAWQELLQSPWIRPRADGRYLTLHDAMAEELAERIIPLHDQDKTWRRALWRRAAEIYAGLIERGEAELDRQVPALNERLADLDRRLHRGDDQQDATQAESIEQVSQLDARKRELDLLKAAHLYYLLLYDFDAGCRQFLDLFGLARDRHNVIFQDLLAFELQRFLPGGDLPAAVGDVIGGAIAEFRAWLTSEGGALYLDMGLSLAEYLIDSGQAAAVATVLDGLPSKAADHRQRYRLNLLRGNACLRVAAQVREGQRYFRRALADAEALTSEDRSRLVARAHNELGFYYRCAGEWTNADRSYEKAFRVLSATLTRHSPDEDRLQMASIQANWAYVKGLGGEYRQGSDLVESAIAVQRRLVRRMEEGISWSVCGEVYRYERRFQKAWDAYAEAERIFLELKNWPGLGILYQEQAICVVQAADDAIVLVPDRNPDELAGRLITMALDICRDQAVRSYPSALNRAGRIFGRSDHEVGLRYLADGVDSARSLSDGWFWFANLIEYVELCCRAWEATGQDDYLDKIAARAPDIEAVMSHYEFPNLRGRWGILQGHLAVHRSLLTGDDGPLDEALQAYIAGFAMIASDHLGSSGASAIPGDFRRFRDLVMRLPPDVQARWLSELRRAWSDKRAGSTLLLARLEQLY